jgi:hypothetical protein
MHYVLPSIKSTSIEQSRKLSFHELCLFSLLVLWLSLLTAIPQHQFTAVLKKHAPARSETSCLRPPKLCFMPALNKLECTLRLLKRMQSGCYSDDFRFLNSVTQHRHISFFMAKQDFYCELSCSDSTSPCRLECCSAPSWQLLYHSSNFLWSRLS